MVGQCRVWLVWLVWVVTQWHGKTGLGGEMMWVGWVVTRWHMVAYGDE